MRKFAVVLGFLMLVSASVDAAGIIAPRSNYGTSQANYQYPKVAQAERAILGRTYEHQDLTARLSRLEKTVFNRTYPDLSLDQRVNNIIVNYNSNSTDEVSLQNLSGIEQNYFGRTFPLESPRTRIERVESKVFGAAQSGDLSSRYQTLKRVSKYPQNNYYTQNSTSPYPYNQTLVGGGGGWRNTRFGSMLLGGGGFPTGYSPQIFSDGVNPYTPSAMDYLDRRGAGAEASGYTSNRGWGYNTRSSGTGTGVTILD